MVSWCSWRRRLFPAGDAAHTVPPTGAKGMLAIADVHVLSRALAEHHRTGRTDLLESYTATALDRVWRSQHFSYWMTSLLHRFPGATDFDQPARRAPVDHRLGVWFTPAENYVGHPLP